MLGLGKAVHPQKPEPSAQQGQAPDKTAVSQTNSDIDHPQALNSITASPKKLESKNKRAISPSDKIGQILVKKNIITAFDLREAMRLKKRQPDKYLGQILCEMGFPQSRIMNGIYLSNKRKRLGEILVDMNLITSEQLQDLLQQQQDLKRKGKHAYLGALLVKNRIISEENYVNALSAHFSMPVVSLKDYQVSPDLQKALGEHYTAENRIVVLNNGELKMIVAIAEPHLSVFDYLEKAIPKGKHIIFWLAKGSEIDACLAQDGVPHRGKIEHPW